MEQNQREWWSQKRRKGKLHFVLLWGGVLWGLPLGIIWILSDFLFTNNYTENSAQFFDKAIFMLCSFFIGGCLFRVYDWNKNESKYLAPNALDAGKQNN
jgi:hypothetical protein